MIVRQIHIVLALVLLVTNGCRGRASHDEDCCATAPERPSTSSGPLGFKYPVARWRLATFETLDRTVLWIGHIAIRHEQSQVETFRPPGWRPDPPNPTRTVAEALAIAEKIHATLDRAPEDFERLAREYSEDVVTRDEGGALGGVRASQLLSNDFLDVLAALKPGQVSRPFRTPYGFHILKRYPPPPEQPVAGERIVIGYRGALGLASESARSRDQALAVAKDVAARAKSDPSSFGALVAQYSENPDRVSHGDLGVYSTRDPGYMATEVQALAHLAVGQVGGPIDGRFGFEILKRVTPKNRPIYAMAAIETGVQLQPGETPEMATARTLKDAEKIRSELKQAPQRFHEFQQNYCCDRVQRWTSGRGDPQLSSYLDELSPGEIAPKPLAYGAGYLIIKRLDPRTLPPEPARLFELPNPSDPDYDAIIRNNDGSAIAAAARSFMGAVRESPAFSADGAKSIIETLESLASYLEQNAASRVAAHDAVVSTLALLERGLDTAQFNQLKTLGRRWLIHQMMPAGSVD